MDSQLLKAFVIVEKHRSFSAAGDALFLTQSAVSKRIQQLEHHLGMPLFERHNRSISLTEAGAQLLPRAHRILDLIQDTEQEISNTHQRIQGQLDIVTSHHIGLHRLPPVLREFVRRYPDVTINLEFMGSERAYEAVRKRDAELALTTLDPHQPKHFYSQPLWTDSLTCVCGPEHQLLEQPVTLALLANTPAILPDHKTITYQLVDDAFQQHGLKLHTPMPTNYLETIKMMVSVGLGWSLLPSGMVDESVRELSWPLPTLKRHLGIARLQGRVQSNACRTFLELINQPTFR